ncbi:MAG: hypothetical protein Q9167_004189 [Letrouitia subvulpina]
MAEEGRDQQLDRQGSDPESEESITYTPIFETGTRELPQDVSTLELTKHTYPNGVRWVIANNPSRPLEGNPTPFYHDTIEQCYEYFKKEFRPAEDSTLNGESTNFTFIVVDDSCLQSDPWEMIIACDAPDYGEGDEEEPKLKYFRMPLERAASVLPALEELTMTPSESQNPDGDVLSFFPPAIMVPVEGEKGNMRLATPKEARENRRRMMRMEK